MTSLLYEFKIAYSDFIGVGVDLGDDKTDNFKRNNIIDGGLSGLNKTNDVNMPKSKLEILYELFNNECSVDNPDSNRNSMIEVNLNDNFTSYCNQIKQKIQLNRELSIFPQNNNFFENLSLYYVSKIWNLWELVITETPLIVQTDSPSQCSQIVFLLSSLIFPLKYCGDIRPYFTIYDSDYKDYRDHENIKSSHCPILGVINPIVIKTLSNCAVRHFGDIFFKENNMENQTKKLQNDSLNEEFVFIPNFKKKFVLSPNKALIKSFLDYILEEKNESLDKLNIYLRMYLIELNNDFMRTFEEYFFTHEIEYIKRIALIKPNFSVFEIFNQEKFLKYLSSGSTNVYFNIKYVKDKKKTNELYAQFVNTKIFQYYLKNLMYVYFY